MVAGDLRRGTRSEANTSETNTAILSKYSVDLIFKTFSRRFTFKFKMTYEDLSARKLLRRDLIQEGVTDEMVQTGLKSCVKLDWPPSTGKFIEFCKSHKPTFYSLPSSVKSSRAVIDNNISLMREKLTGG